MSSVDYIQEYIKKVNDGEILVPKTIQQAIDRHLADLELSNTPDFPYEYDHREANKAISFISKLPDPKTLKTFPLALFQKFIISMLYGWREKGTGYRRFRKAYISLARKQGKTLLAGGIAINHLIYEQEPFSNRQIYCTANSRDQAKIVFDQMITAQLKALMKISKAMRKNISIKQNHIAFKEGRAFIKPLASDTQTLDGLDVSLGILDEYGASKDRGMLEILESSQLQQRQPLILITSTATENLTSPMFVEEYPYAKKILTGDEENHRYLALIWEQDSIQEIEQEEMWIKSNPILEVEAMYEQVMDYLRGRLKEALAKGNTSGIFTKNFNMWTQSTTDAFMNAEEWMNCTATKQYDITGRDIYVGLDLSKVGDLTSVGYVIPLPEENKLLIDSHSFVATRISIEQRNELEKLNYHMLEEQGYCSISSLEGGYIDYDAVIAYINQLISDNNLNLKGIYFDPYAINAVHHKLSQQYGESNLIEVRQGYKTLSPPTVQLQIDIANGKIIHRNNPLLDRAVLTAQTKWDNGAKMIEKKKLNQKIDPLASILNAYTEVMLLDAYIDYEKLYGTDENIF